MEFTRTKKGTKLVLIGEILLIAALSVSIAASVLFILTGSVLASSAEAVAAIATMMFMGSAGIAFAAQVLVIIGLIVAGKDASAFRISLIFTIVCILCDSASGFLQTFGAIPVMIATALSAVVFAFAVCFGLKGIAAVGEKADNTALAEKSRNMMKAVVAVTALSVILTVCGGILGLNAANELLSSVLTVAASVLSVVVVILYITVLKKTKTL